MSASREKKVRQEQQSSGYTDPKTAKEAKEHREAKRSNTIYLLVAIAFVVVATISLVWKSGITERNVTAVTIDGENYTAAETQYYYINNYQSFVSDYYYYLSYFGLDTSKSLKDQECAMTDDGSSWYDYFLDQATKQMAAIQSLCAAAEEEGMKWDDSMQADFDAALESLQSSTDSYNASQGTNLQAKGYLQLIYGKLVNMATYEKLVKNAILAQHYADAYQATLTYTADQLDAEYAENSNRYDYVNYEMISISGKAASTTDADGNTVAPTEEESAAALESAKALADSLYAQYQAGGILSKLAETDDKANYSANDKASYSDSTLMNWLFDESRQANDSAVLFDENTSSYYVVRFNERYRDETKTVDVRHILIQVDETGLDSESDSYDAELQARKDEAKAKADEIFAQWKNGGATEDSFAALANEYSEDPGSNSTGGLYEQVTKGSMVDAFDAWCFDDARKSGDADVVYAERTNSGSDYKGYHIIYYVGDDLPVWQVTVTNTLKSADYNTWYSQQTGSEEITLVDKGVSKVG